MADAAGLFDRLYQCLVEQEKIIDRLITIGEDQLEAFKENDLIRFNKITAEQKVFAAQMEKAEEERLLIQVYLESRLNVEKGATLSQLLPYAPEPVKASLKEVLVVLRHKMQNLKEINSLSSAMIKRILMVNSRLIQIINASVPKTYGLKGEIQGKLHFASVLNENI